MEEKLVEWEEINQLFGPLVEADLKESNVILEKTLTGGLVVPKKYGFILDDCRHLFKKKLTKKNEKSDIYEQRMMKCRPEVYDLDDEDNFDLFVNFRRTLNFSPSNVVESSSSTSQNSQISNKSTTLVNSSTIKKKENEKSLKTPDYVDDCNYESFTNQHVFTNNTNTAAKFREFMGNEFKGYESCIPLIEPIFEKFMKKHQRFGYKYILKKIPQEASLMKGQLSVHQLRGYFRRIFRAVIPVELFGNSRNTRKIRKMVNKYLQTAFGEYFSAQTVTSNLNISAVEWLRVIEDDITKISIMSQLVESFFEKYIMAVLGTYIYTEKMTWSNEKIFIRMNQWIYHTTKYIARQKANGVYQNITNNELKEEIPNNIPVAKLTLHMKKNGIRPILLINPTPAQKRETTILNKLLYQLFLKKFELVKPQKLEQLWRTVHETCSGKVDRPLYFISCDIHDAFGSINQQKLLEILFSMMDELDDKLVVQNFAIFNPRFSAERYIYREYFDCPSLPLALPLKTLCCRDTNKRNTILGKEWLKRRMQSYIMRRRITINNKLHYQLKGVGQGVPLTSLLCEIYYSHMVIEELASFMKSGHLFRYVDDFLYFTEDKTSAERFLDQVHRGIQSYNCTFNTKKTSSNLPPYSADEFVYLGYRFNLKTFDVLPEFPDVPVRYLITLSTPNAPKTLSILEKRLANFQYLKVVKLVLDPTINSKKSIEKTIHQIIMQSGKRCLAFLLGMLDLKDISGYRIFTTVKKYSVDPLCIKISRLCFATNRVPAKDFNSIKKSIWKAYGQVFCGNTELYKKLGPRIKFLLKSLSETD